MKLSILYWIVPLSLSSVTSCALDTLNTSLTNPYLAAPDYQRLPTDHVITLFIRPCFCSRDCANGAAVQEMLQDPASINRNIITYCLKSIRQQGINALYYGMTTNSDATGKITFPRKQISNDMLLVITTKPRPVLGQGVTVNRWIVDPLTPVAYYSCTQQLLQNQLVWNVQKVDAPAHNIIPPDALVIIADPDDVIVHEGFTTTVESPSLILPTIYTKKGINLDKDALSLLNINRYFSLTKKVVNYSQDRYAIMVQP